MKEADPRRAKYLEARSKGLSRVMAAKQAGYAESNAGHIEESPSVMEELAVIRADAAANANVTRDDVVNGLKDAADLAKLLSDPTGMVAAWRELGKVLGFYAPEVKKIEKGISKSDLLKAMDQLSDEELLKLTHGRVVVDGEFTRVAEPAKLPAVQKG